jgi:hypothetical protein
MANISWPTSNNFPQSPQKGFTETIGINILRSNMDMGPAKQRRRSARPSVLGVNFILTSAQVNQLEAFIKDQIKGVFRFNFTHPRTSTTVEARIVPQGDGEFYKLTYLAPGFYQTDLSLEILP